MSRRPALAVFLILLGSYAYFWQSRDWNSASRLMLAYSLVDRGTVAINGLQAQTGDRAFARGWYYTDKLPGFSFLAAAPYGLLRALGGSPPHPLNGPALAHWPADYAVTLATSGMLTALTGAWLVLLARDLGCGPRRAALVGLGYGLATPAYAYATLSYGHQAAAFSLLASFALLRQKGGRRPALRAGLAGFCAAYAALIEIQVGPVAAVLTAYLLVKVTLGRGKLSWLGDFAVGAALPTCLLLGYNQLAFGSPWDMGYFHHANALFAGVHSDENPLGLRAPAWGRAWGLLWGRYRGLLFYAPLTTLVPFGLTALARRRQWDVAVVAAAAMGAVFTVNVSYDQWTGGWSTGPRLLVPLLPFALVAVSGWLATATRRGLALAAALSFVGALLMLLFVAVGGRLSQDFPDPLLDAVWPLWRGDPLPAGWPGTRFARNACRLVAPGWVDRLPASSQWLQFVPLVAAQAAAIAWALRPSSFEASDLRVDQQ